MGKKGEKKRKGKKTRKGRGEGEMKVLMMYTGRLRPKAERKGK